MVAGSARSGTTWIGDLLAEAARARVVFEPFHHDQVEEFRPIGAFPYRRVSDTDEALLRFCERVLSGSLSGPWVDREVERLVTRRRVVKAVRANLMLAWLAERFPEVPVVLVMRHPCAVVASRMALGWSPQPDLDALLAQPALMGDLLVRYRDLIDAARTEEERSAVVWCVHHLVPLRQQREGAFTTLFYESMCLQPEVELPRLLAAAGGDLRQVRPSHLDRPSTTSRLASASVTGEDRVSSWQRSLSDRQIERILGIVRAFGLDVLYDDSPLPHMEPFRFRPALPGDKAVGAS